MKETLLRVWHDDKMWDVEYINFERSEIGLLRGQQETLEQVSTTINKCVIMQYAGMDDKNGKKIFEHDITEQWNEMNVVFWRPGNFVQWKIREIDLSNPEQVQWAYMGVILDHSKYRSIVGNVYENPELVKENKWLMKELNLGAKK